MIYKFNVLLLLLLLVSYSKGFDSNSSSIGFFEVCIPTYNEAGRINWELHADELDKLDEGIYSAQNPKMFILEDQRPATIANSNTGFFNLGQGLAKGREHLFVEGDGFEAIGRPWTFEENITDARNCLAFSEQGKIGFESQVNAGFVGVSDEGVNKRSKKSKPSFTADEIHSIDSPNFSKDFPTTAYGRKIDIFDLGDGRRRFLLQTDVFIEMQDIESNGSDPQVSTISCDWAELFLGSDGNSSTNSFGSISEIHALGNVKLNQPLRESSADELNWSEESGQVNLHGNAKVSHQKWGVAIGEHIILLEEDGRAEVIGGNKGRSKLLLPALNKTNATQ